MKQEPETIRIAHQNVNGLCPYGDWGHLETLAHNLNRQNIHILSISEPNICWTEERKNKMKSTFNRHVRHARIVTTNIQENTTKDSNLYQPGGTMIVCHDKWSGRAHQVDTDPTKLGRWSVMKLQGKGKKIINIISAYRPNEHNNNTKHDSSQTIYLQQQRILQQNDDDANPRDKILEDLKKLVEKMKANHEEIILMIDAKEKWSGRSKWRQFTRDTNLYDIHTIFHNDKDVPNTYNRGKNRIDYIVCNPDIINSIQRCGYLRFDEGPAPSSDHRTIYVDLKSETLFDDITTEKRQDIAQRNLHSNDRNCVMKYLHQLGKIVQDNKLIEKCNDLYERRETSDDTITDKLEEIDKILTESMLKIEKSCRRPPIPWSPKLKLHQQIVQAWALRLSLDRNKRGSEDLFQKKLKTIRKLMKQVELEDRFDSIYDFLDLTKPKKKLRRARRYLNKLYKKAREFRYEFLCEQHMKAKDNDETKRAAILKRIINAEEKKYTFQKIRRYIKPRGDGNMNYLEVPMDPNQNPKDKNCKDWRRVENVAEMNKLLTERNRKHFHQAEGTPFTINPLEDDLEHSGMTESGEEILNGTYIPLEDLDPTTKTLIKNLRRKCDELPNADINEDELRSAFKKWKESTSSSPSGRHLGHMKTLTTKLTDKEKKTWPDDTAKTHEIFHIIYQMIMICHARTYPLRRWLTCYNMLIQKIIGNMKIHKQRVIHLQECDWQAILKITTARKTIRHAEQKNALHIDQGGGTPGKSSIDPAIFNVMESDYCNMRLQPSVGMYNDAEACYDRLVESVTNLSLRAIGCPKEHLQLHSEVHQNMKYYIKTSNGIHDEYSCHKDYHFWGAGQGACDASARCTAATATIFDTYQQIADGLHIKNPTRRRELEHHLLAFVDDSKTSYGIDKESTNTELTKQITNNTSKFEKCEHSTGGKLEISKCDFFIRKYKNNKKGIPQLMNKNEHDLSIELESSGSGEKQKITQMEIWEPYKYLGVMQCPNGNTGPQHGYLLKKGTKYEIVFSACPLNRNEIITGYYTCYLPSITYPLPACHLQEHELKNIFSKAVNVILSKMGFNNNFPRAAVYCPISFGGLGLRHLYCEQGIGQITKLIAHTRAETKLGKMMLTVIDWYQQLAGISQHILTDTRPIPGTRNKWLSSLRQFLRHIRAQIRSVQAWTIPTIRENDLHIMDAVLQSPNKYRYQDLEVFNTVRQYMQVTTLAELRNNDGLTFHKGAFGKINETTQQLEIRTFHESKLDWPDMDRPPPSAFKIWQNILLKELKEKPRLGAWKAKSTHRYILWKMQQQREISNNQPSLSTHHLYRKDDDEWKVKTPVVKRRYMYLSSTPRPAPHSPDTFLPPAIPGHNNIPLPITDKMIDDITSDPTDTDPVENFEDNTWVMDLDNPEEVKRIIEDNEYLIITSDGSHDHIGTYAWIIANNNEDIIARGRGNVSGNIRMMQSFRAEACGLLRAVQALIYSMDVLTEENPDIAENERYWSNNRINIPIKVYCDSESNLKRLRNWMRYDFIYPTLRLANDYDMSICFIEEVKETINTSQISFHHVKGHQDRHKKFDDLSWPEKLNCMCDKAAGKITNVTPIDRPVHLSYYTKTDLIIDGEFITSNIKANIRSAFGTGPMREYLQEKWQWSDETIEDIDWEAHGRALHRLPNSARISTTKMIHRWLPTSARQHELSQGRHPASCPICNHDHEDQYHFLSCQHKQYNTVRTNFSKRISTYCDTYNCPPDISRLLQISIQHWPDPPIDKADFPSSLHTLIQHQQQIGWEQVYYGRFSIEWTREFNRHALLEGRDTNGGKWITGITEIIFIHLHTRWKHRSNLAHDNSHKKTTQKMICIDNTIRDLYSRRHEVPPHRQQPFKTPLPTLLKKSTATKRKWIELNEKHIKTLIVQQLDQTIKSLYLYQQHLPTTHHHLFKPTLEKLLRRPPVKKKAWLLQRQTIIEALVSEHNITLHTHTETQASELENTTVVPVSPETSTPLSPSASITSLVSNFYDSAQKLVTRFLNNEKDTQE